MHHHCRGMWIRSLRVGTEPAPTPIPVLHLPQTLHPLAHHSVYLLLVPDRIPLPLSPLRCPGSSISNLLGVQVRPLVLHLIEINIHILQKSLGNHRWDEAVHGLLRAPVGVVREVWQRINHRPRDRWRVTNLETGLLRLTLLRNLKIDRHSLFSPPESPAPRFCTEHSMNVNRKAHLHRVRIVSRIRNFISSLRNGLHSDHDISLPNRDCLPIHSPFASGRYDYPGNTGARNLHCPSFQLKGHINLPGFLMVIVHHRAQDNFVAFNEKAWRLQPNNKILAGYHFRYPLTHPGSVPQGPDLDFPCRKVVGILHLDFGLSALVGRNRSRPLDQVRKLRSHHDL